MTLHTGPNCTIAGSGQTGQKTSGDCQAYPNYYVGCSVQDASDLSYGNGFNNNGGGLLDLHHGNSTIKLMFLRYIRHGMDVELDPSVVLPS